MTEQILRECEECHAAVGELAVFQHMAKHAADARDAVAREERISQLVVRAEEAVAALRGAGAVAQEVAITLVTREEAEALGGATVHEAELRDGAPMDGFLGDEAAPEDVLPDRPFSRY